MQIRLLTANFGWQVPPKFEKILKYSVSVGLLVFLFGGVAVAADSFGDPFEKGKLQNPNWKWQNEPPKWDVGKTRENFLYIDSEPNRNLWANDMSHFLYQETDTDMFDVETHFFAKWDTSSGVNGLVVKSPKDDNWVTIKFWSRDAARRDISSIKLSKPEWDRLISNGDLGIGGTSKCRSDSKKRAIHTPLGIKQQKIRIGWISDKGILS